MAVKQKRSVTSSPFETYVDQAGNPVSQYVSPQAAMQARGLGDDNATVDQYREGPDIADERADENAEAVRLGKGGKAAYPQALVTPHGH